MTELQVRSRGPLVLNLNFEAYFDLCQDYGLSSDVRVADAFGVNRSVATRIRHAQQRVGNPFLAGMYNAFEFQAHPERLGELFVVVDDPAPHRLTTARRLGRVA